MKKTVNSKCVVLLGVAAMFAGSAFAGDLETLCGNFRNPPEKARIQAWWHWIGDNSDKDRMLRDLDAMHDFGVGTVHVFSSYAMYEVQKYWKSMLSEPWMDVFRAVLKRAREHGMKVGFHNCPGWSASGGPWIPVEKSMKVLVASEADVPQGATSVRVPVPRAVKHSFYRDVALLAVQVKDDPEPVSRSLELPAALPISSPGSSVSIVYGFSAPVTNFTTAVIEFDDVTFRTPFKVEASPDGKNWSVIADTTLQCYQTTLTPKTVALSPAPAGSKFFRTTFAYMETPSHVPHIDLRLRSLTFTTLSRISDLDAQTGLSGHGMRYAMPEPGAENPSGIPANLVRDVSSALGKDGVVDLAAAALPPAPEGSRWRLMRFGFTTTGACNKPAPVSGLECDKLDRSGIEAHWPNMPGRLASMPEAKGVLEYCIIDSYEAGGQNWTDRMPERFRSLRGYRLIPWLPALIGYVIEDGRTSAKFLYDFQRTLSDLFRTEYYGRFVELCRESGLTSMIEGYDGPYDQMEVSMLPDVPVGEFWLTNAGASNADVNKTPFWASSAAHLRGVPYVAAESFTTEAKQGRWQATPAELRMTGDRAWLNGISQIVYHSYVAQIFDNVKPGMSLSYHGTQLNRNTTWWPEGRAWADYVARGQALLQSGHSRSEFLIVSGEGNPGACAESPLDIVSAGFGFDWIPASMLSKLIVTSEGKVGMPGLPPYEALLLPSDRCFSHATALQLNRLLLAGAKLAGKRPLDSPKLQDDWANWNHVVSEVCPGLPHDWRSLGLRPFADSSGRLLSRRRDVGDTIIYYMLNDGDSDFSGTVSFAAANGVKAELWRAEDASRTALRVIERGDGRVSVMLELPARHSAFVVLSPDCEEFRPQPCQRTVSVDLSSGWTVAFDGPGAPGNPVRFERLESWSESDDVRIRYFSGRARYVKRVQLPRNVGKAVRLELGDVRELANVYVNGRRVSTVWQSPYIVDMTEDAGREFELCIEVVNTWPNRLIGDAIFRRDNPGCEKMGDPKVWHAWASNNPVPPNEPIFPQWVLDERPDSGTGVFTWSNYTWAWSVDDPLLPGGLIGPVALKCLEVRGDQ